MSQAVKEPENARWITQTGNCLYAVIFEHTGFQSFLLENTTPDGQMGQGLARAIEFFQGLMMSFLNLIKLLFYRIAVLLACLSGEPYW